MVKLDVLTRPLWKIGKNGVFCILCKNGYKKGLKLQDLSGFYAWKSHYPDYKGVVYYTDKLSRNIKQLQSNPKIEFIQLKAISLDENSTQPNITVPVMEKIVIEKDQIIDCKCIYCNTSLLKKYVFPEKNPVLYKNKDTKHKQIKPTTIPRGSRVADVFHLGALQGLPKLVENQLWVYIGTLGVGETRTQCCTLRLFCSERNN